MDIQKIILTARNGLSAAGFALRKNSPQILAVTGVIGVGVSFVLACKASLKVNDILEESKGNLDKVEKSLGKVTKDGEEYTEEIASHDKFIIGAQTVYKLAKVYAVPLLIGVVSVGSLLLSNRILTKRNIAITAAYTAIKTTFRNYRDNVVDRFGKEVDYQLLNNIKALKVKETTVDENGNEVETDKTVYVQEENSSSPVYSCLICEGSTPYWEKSPLYTLSNLKKLEWTANQMLMARGHLTVNDIYDLLEMPRVRGGFDYGWRYFKDGIHPYGGDNYISFGLDHTTTDDVESLSRFEKGLEENIWLNFNVDGPIIATMSNADFQRG